MNHSKKTHDVVLGVLGFVLLACASCGSPSAKEPAPSATDPIPPTEPASTRVLEEEALEFIGSVLSDVGYLPVVMELTTDRVLHQWAAIKLDFAADKKSGKYEFQLSGERSTNVIFDLSYKKGAFEVKGRDLILTSNDGAWVTILKFGGQATVNGHAVKFMSGVIKGVKDLSNGRTELSGFIVF